MRIHVFLFMGLLAWSCSCYFGFGVVGPFTSSAFKCLHASVTGSTTYAVVRVYQNSHSPAGIDSNGLQTMINAFEAGFAANVDVELCRGINATSQINLVNTEILSPLATFNQLIPQYHFFYIKVQPTSNPECSWEGYSHSDNCNFLKEAANAVNNLGWITTIFSTANIWKHFFGSSCDTFAADTQAIMGYANYDRTGQVNSVQSFDDYVPFGGWIVAPNSVMGKQVGGNVTVPLLCGHKAWHAFVD